VRTVYLKKNKFNFILLHKIPF